LLKQCSCSATIIANIKRILPHAEGLHICTFYFVDTTIKLDSAIDRSLLNFYKSISMRCNSNSSRVGENIAVIDKSSVWIPRNT
jgi:hypothetical protein